MSEDKLIRRIYAQTENVTLTAQTKFDVTEKQAIDDVMNHVLSANVQYRNYVVLPVCTEEQWKGGNVNFCPRCGHRLAEFSEDIETEYYAECPDCYAELRIEVIVP